MIYKPQNVVCSAHQLFTASWRTP